MAFIPESSNWTNSIYQLDPRSPAMGGDPVKGGTPVFSGDVPTDGFSNAQAKQLADRTLFLKNAADTSVTDLASDTDPLKGAALVGFDSTLSYPSGSVGTMLNSINDELLDLVTMVSVKDFGVTLDGVTDDTSAMQAALNEAKSSGIALYIPPGDMLITASLVYDTTGLGFYRGLRLYGSGQRTSRIVNSINAAGVGAASLKLTSGASTSDQQHGGFVSDIGFIQVGAGTGGHGVEYRGTWHQRFENLNFEALTGSALRVSNISADADSSAHVEINFIRAMGCIGPAFDSNGGTGGVSIHTIRNIYSVNCGQSDAHVVIDGCVHFKLEQVSITGAPGVANYVATQKAIRIKNTSIGPRNISITGGEIGNWLQKGIVVDAVQGLTMGEFRFVKRAGETTFITGIEFADGGLGNCNSVSINPINLQIDHASPAFTFLAIGTGINERFSARAAYITSFAAGSIYCTLGDTAAARIGYLEDSNGRILYSRGSTLFAQTVATAGTTTLSLLNGSLQRLVLSATGAHTIAAPIGNTGQGFDLIIINGSGGAITVTFTGFVGVSGYTDPANGAARTAKFIRDNFSAAWRQIGGWST